LLLALLLFNWFGYRLLSSFMEEKANRQLETALDNNEYDEAQLISIKIPVTYLPYYNNSPSFERIDGQVEIEGTEYKYVKRRIFNDSLELLCIPNAAMMKLKKVKNEFFQFVNDLQHGGQDKNNNTNHSVSKTFSTDYYTIDQGACLVDPWFTISIRLFHHISPVTSRHRLIVEEPPESI
jgi:hypothetical protein